MKIYAFIDTNVFLEYQEYTQLDWPRLLGAREVCLVVAPMVRKELEDHRRDPRSPRRQKRARDVSGKLRTLAFSVMDGEEADVPERPAVTYLEIARSPKMNDYPELSPSEQDDHIIAAVLDFQKQRPDVDILVVSGDTGMCFKARHYGLKQMFLSEDYLLPDEPTLEQRQVRDLERRLKLLENPSPTLEVTFAGTENNVIRLPRPKPIDDFVASCEKRVLSLLDDLAGYEHRSLKAIEMRRERRTQPELSKKEVQTFDASFVSRVKEGLAKLSIGPRHFDEKLLHPLRIGFETPYLTTSIISDKPPRQRLVGDDIPWYEAVKRLDALLAEVQRAIHNEERDRQYKPLVLSIKNSGGTPADDLEVRVHTPRHDRELASGLDTWYWSDFQYQGYKLAPEWRQGSQELTNALEASFKTIKPGAAVEKTVGYVRVPESEEPLEVEVEIIGRNLATPVRLTYLIQAT